MYFFFCGLRILLFKCDRSVPCDQGVYFSDGTGISTTMQETPKVGVSQYAAASQPLSTVSRSAGRGTIYSKLY